MLDGMSGMYLGMHCIDFSSLYPNIVIQHNIDALSVVATSYEQMVATHGPMSACSYYVVSADGQVVGLRDSKGTLTYFRQNVDAVLPSVLSGLLREREALKEQMKKVNKDSIEYRALAGQEQARKVGANGACGALGEQTKGNPMSYCKLNDIITTTGRTILRIAENEAKVMGASVVYGDTDSLMLLVGKHINHYLASVHSLLPSRIRFKVEYVADVFIMGKKKHYVAKVGSDVKIAGYKAVKSSSCKMAQKVMRELVEKLLHEGPELILQQYEHDLNMYEQLVHELDVDALVSNFRYKGKAYKHGTFRCNLINNMRNRGVELVAGNTLSVLTIKTQETYLRIYGHLPSHIALPRDSDPKAAKVYTVEEIGSNLELVDVRDILETQCGADLRSIIHNCRVKHVSG